MNKCISILCQVVINTLKKMKQGGKEEKTEVGGHIPMVVREGSSEVTLELRLER